MNTTAAAEAANTAAAAASWALAQVGCPYSQPKRTQPGIFDCSSLVDRAYTNQGKKWLYGGSVPISCDAVYDDDFRLLWPASYADIGKTMGGKDVISKADQPGDVQYVRTDSSTKRANRITHVAMVAGKGKIVHARGAKYGVVTSPISLYAGKVCAVVRYDPACALRKGMKGYRTLALQQRLRFLGYRLEADGDFGAETLEAVKAFQAARDLPVTEMADTATLEALSLDETIQLPQTETNLVTVTGETVNIRSGPGTNYPIRRTARQGDTFPYVEAEGWIPIRVADQIQWISAKYAQRSNRSTSA